MVASILCKRHTHGQAVQLFCGLVRASLPLRAWRPSARCCTPQRNAIQSNDKPDTAALTAAHLDNEPMWAWREASDDGGAQVEEGVRAWQVVGATAQAAEQARRHPLRREHLVLQHSHVRRTRVGTSRTQYIADMMDSTSLHAQYLAHKGSQTASDTRRRHMLPCAVMPVHLHSRCGECTHMVFVSAWRRTLKNLASALVSAGFTFSSFSKPGVAVSGGYATDTDTPVDTSSLRNASASARTAALGGAYDVKPAQSKHRFTAWFTFQTVHAKAPWQSDKPSNEAQTQAAPILQNRTCVEFLNEIACLWGKHIYVHVHPNARAPTRGESTAAEAMKHRWPLPRSVIEGSSAFATW